MLAVAVGQRKRTRTSSRSVYGSRKGDEADSPDWFHQICSDTDVRECGEGKLFCIVEAEAVLLTAVAVTRQKNHYTPCVKKVHHRVFYRAMHVVQSALLLR